MAVALDTPLWTWTTGGSAPWAPQNSVTHDGVGALQSGTISNSQTSWVETAMSGPVTVMFWWKVSSETNNDVLRFFVDGSEQLRISGEVDWRLASFDLLAGNHTLRWAYSKNSSTTTGQDRGWLDQVSIVCGYALSPASRDHGPAADTGQISVITSNALCTWSVLNTNAWITITSGVNGAGTGSVQYSLAANPNLLARTGGVMVAGQLFAVHQAGIPCTFTISPLSRVHLAGSETGLVNVLTIDGCAWAADSTNDWINITSSTNGVSNGSIGYHVAPNPTLLERIGYISIADQTFTITNLGGLVIRGTLSAPDVLLIPVQTVSGHYYTIEFSDALPGTKWTALPAIAGDGTVSFLTAPAPPGGQRFYRVKVQ